MYHKKSNDRTVIWSSPLTVLTIDQSFGLVKITGNYGCPFSADMEDVRLAFTEDEFAQHATGTNYQLSAIIKYLTDNLSHSMK